MDIRGGRSSTSRSCRDKNESHDYRQFSDLSAFSMKAINGNYYGVSMFDGVKKKIITFWKRHCLRKINCPCFLISYPKR